MLAGDLPLAVDGRATRFVADDPLKVTLKEGDVERSQVIRVAVAARSQARDAR